jgi:hypothetical protein
MVRRFWYIYCFYFLTKINKDWNANLQPARLRKKAFIFDNITTSDEAMIHWFIKIWTPKLEQQSKNGWQTEEKGKSVPEMRSQSVEQELKAGLKDYVAIHHRILENKKSEQGALALRWNDIFWEEVVANHPSAFKDTTNVDNTHGMAIISDNNDEIIVLPDADDDNVLLELFQKQKSLHAISASNGPNNDMQTTSLLSKEDLLSTCTPQNHDDVKLSPDDLSDNDQNIACKVQAHPI